MNVQQQAPLVKTTWRVTEGWQTRPKCVATTRTWTTTIRTTMTSKTRARTESPCPSSWETCQSGPTTSTAGKRDTSFSKMALSRITNPNMTVDLVVAGPSVYTKLISRFVYKIIQIIRQFFKNADLTIKKHCCHWYIFCRIFLTQLSDNTRYRLTLNQLGL